MAGEESNSSRTTRVAAIEKKMVAKSGERASGEECGWRKCESYKYSSMMEEYLESCYGVG